MKLLYHLVLGFGGFSCFAQREVSAGCPSVCMSVQREERQQEIGDNKLLRFDQTAAAAAACRRHSTGDDDCDGGHLKFWADFYLAYTQPTGSDGDGDN